MGAVQNDAVVCACVRWGLPAWAQAYRYGSGQGQPSSLRESDVTIRTNFGL